MYTLNGYMKISSMILVSSLLPQYSRGATKRNLSFFSKNVKNTIYAAMTPAVIFDRF